METPNVPGGATPNSKDERALNDLTRLIRKEVAFTSTPGTWKDPKTKKLLTHHNDGTPVDTKLLMNHVTVEFTSVEDACEAAQRFVVWILQRLIRLGEMAPGQTIRCKSDGSIIRPISEVVKTMSRAEMVRAIAAMQAQMELLAAQEMADNPTTEDNDDFTPDDLGNAGN